jgi:hypothetical protein
MRSWIFSFFVVTMVLAFAGFAAAQGPQVVKVDNKISVHANDISLGYLLHLWDQATGMHSSIPPDLAQLSVSVQFNGLNTTDAVQKIFEKQPVNYVLVDGQGIVVTGLQAAAETEPAPIYDNEQPVPEAQEGIEQPELQPLQKPSPGPPSAVWTPFGLTPTPPNGFQPMLQLPPVLAAPPQPPFFGVPAPTVPPAGAPYGPVINPLFAPTPIYQSPALPIPGAPQPAP